MATARSKWETISQTPEIVDFFAGLFDRVGVRIVDTEEEFTCEHRANYIVFEDGIDAKNVDYTVEIQSHQVDRLVKHTDTGELDETEQYRVISTIFTPAAAATLKIPLFTNKILRWFCGAEDVIHVYLKSPSKDEKDVSHTLIFARRQWIVVSGLHGIPGRTFRLNMHDAHLYQRHAFRAIKSGWKELFAFSQWYRLWRGSVSGC